MSNIAPPFASSPAPSLFPQLTFTQGFLVGQVSVIVIVIALIRYLLLEDPATDDLTAQNQQQHHHSAKVSQSPSTTSYLLRLLIFLSHSAEEGRRLRPHISPSPRLILHPISP